MASSSLLDNKNLNKLYANKVSARSADIKQLNVEDILNADDINMNKNIGWIITLVLKKNVKMENVADIVRPMVESARTESGCLVYDFAASVNQENTVILTEEYLNLDAVYEHMDNLNQTGFIGSILLNYFDIGVAITYTATPPEVVEILSGLETLAHAVVFTKRVNLIAR